MTDYYYIFRPCPILASAIRAMRAAHAAGVQS